VTVGEIGLWTVDIVGRSTVLFVRLLPLAVEVLHHFELLLCHSGGKCLVISIVFLDEFGEVVEEEDGLFAHDGNRNAAVRASPPQIDVIHGQRRTVPGAVDCLDLWRGSRAALVYLNLGFSSSDDSGVGDGGVEGDSMWGDELAFDAFDLQSDGARDGEGVVDVGDTKGLYHHGGWLFWDDSLVGFLVDLDGLEVVRDDLARIRLHVVREHETGGLFLVRIDLEHHRAGDVRGVDGILGCGEEHRGSVSDSAKDDREHEWLVFVHVFLDGIGGPHLGGAVFPCRVRLFGLCGLDGRGDRSRLLISLVYRSTSGPERGKTVDVVTRSRRTPDTTHTFCFSYVLQNQQLGQHYE